MSAAKSGDKVRVHYTGKLEDGTEFDSSRDRGPLEFELGTQKLLPGFESTVEGMAPGETKSCTIEAEDAYGEYHPEGVLEIERSQLPPDVEVSEGQVLEMQHQDGRKVLVKVIAVTDETITIDSNHPLAGKKLFLDIELLEIVVAPTGGS